MIPEIQKVREILSQASELAAQPSDTYRMDMESITVAGCAEGLEAVKQAVYKILLTERYEYIIYSGNYGIELKDLFGQPVSYVCPELERRITEALTWDDRIDSVSDFVFSFPEKGTVAVSFTVNSIFGSFNAAREVRI